MHKAAIGSECEWPTSYMRRGGYDFGGWAHFKKGSHCFLKWYGWRAGTLYNLTLNHTPGSKAWWGRGTTRDVMTMLLREKLLFATWTEPQSRATISYLWCVHIGSHSTPAVGPLVRMLKDKFVGMDCTTNRQATKHTSN